MNKTDDIKILLAASQKEFDDAIELFKQYANAINFDAGFKNFRTDLASLNTHYSVPDGCLLYLISIMKQLVVLQFEKCNKEWRN